MSAVLDQIWRDAWRPPDRRPPWLWAEEHVPAISYSPIPGGFRADHTPWIREPLEALVDPRRKFVIVKAAVQSGKTTLAEIGSSYIIANMPGPMLWLDYDDNEAKDQAESRLTKLYDSIEPVRALYPGNRHAIKTATKHFSNGMTQWVLGANNKSNLQRRSIRWLIGDECWQWEQGRMAEAEARVTAFGWLGKCLFMSQGSEEEDDFDKKFLETDQREWTFQCPECHTRQPFLWENVEWSKDAHSIDGWDFERVRETVRLHCSNDECSHTFEDTDRQRAVLNATGRYVPRNPKASTEKVGFHWNSLCSMSWGKLAEMYLRAKAEAKRGDIENLKIFYQKRLALSWSDRLEDFKFEIAPGSYKLGDPWTEEGGFDDAGNIIAAPFDVPVSARLRFLTVDCQMDHFYLVVASWSANGSSRRIWRERVLTWDDIEAVREKFDVAPRLTFVDAGHATYDVYKACAHRGYTALMGDRRGTFQHVSRDGGTPKKVWRFYSPKRKVTIRHGLDCEVFYWSNLNVKDLLARLRSNQDADKGPTWEVPGDIGDDYLAQMDSERRLKKNDKWAWERIGKRDNHYWDCEAMQVVAALMLKLVGRESVKPDPEDAGD